MTSAKEYSGLSWAQAFIGMPYADKGRTREGCDCWGLIRIVYADRLGIELPSYDSEYVGSDERREISAIVEREAQSALWERVETPRPFDILFFRRGRFDAHAAIWVKAGLMLHMVEEDCSKIERFDVPAYAFRLTGMYRWRGAA